MQALKMTTKRQVTFPVKTCEELNIKPGESIMLEKRKIDGAPAWVLLPSKQVNTQWFGAFKNYAEGKSNEINDIRNSIGKKRFGEL